MSNGTAAPAPTPRWTVIPVGLAFAFLLALALRTIGDGDCWRHLAAGRHQAEAGIPRVDHLSFTAEEKPWVDDTWLYERLLHALWRAGGAPLVGAVHAALAGAAFGLMAFAGRRWTRPLPLAFAVLICGWLAAAGLGTTPLVAALAFPAAFVALLGVPRRAPVLAAALVPLQVLWTNLHPSFLLGPAIAALWATERWFAERGRPAATEAQPAGDVRILLGLPVVLLLATLVNPYGFGLLGHVVRAWSNPAYRYFQVWVSPYSSLFGSSWTRHGITAALLLGATGLVLQKSRLPVVLTGLAVVGAFLVIHSVRHLPLFALLAFPFLGLSLRAAADAVTDFLALRLDLRVPAGPAVGAATAGALSAASLLAVIGGHYYASSGSPVRFGLGAEESHLPAAAASVLARPGMPARVLNLPTDGGYLLWAAPGRKVFADSRAAVYGEDFYRLLARLLAGETDAQAAVFQRWRVDGAWLNCTWPGIGTTARALVDSGAWGLAYFDGTSALLVTRTPAHAALLGDAALQRAGLDRLAAAADRTRAGAREGTPPLIGAASLFLAFERNADARPLLELLVARHPGAHGLRLKLGICQAKLGDFEAAEPHLARVANAQPRNAQAWFWLAQVAERLGRTSEAQRAIARARELGAREAAAAESKP